MTGLPPALRPLLSRIYRSGAVRSLRASVQPPIDLWLRAGKAYHRRLGTRRVLLLGETPMMVGHAIETWHLLDGDDRIEGHLAVPRRFRGIGRTTAGAEDLTLHRLSLARLRWWDLVITANHVAPFSTLVPVLRVQHGMVGDGKILHGQPFTYGRRRVLRPDGSPAYTQMWEGSGRVRDQVVASLPQLAPVITVVGSLAADRVHEWGQRRAGAGTRPGTSPVPTVVVMSTFGHLSLMETIGHELLETITRLSLEGRYRFIVCAHPNLWSAQRKVAKPWDATLLALRSHGVVVAEPDDDWPPLLADADVALSDHTSLCVAYAVLGRPLITVPLPPRVLADGGIVARLHASTPTLEKVEDLDTTLQLALADGLSDDAREVAKVAFSHLGESETRRRCALHSLLELEHVDERARPFAQKSSRSPIVKAHDDMPGKSSGS